MTFKWTKLIRFHCQIAGLPSSNTAATVASALISGKQEKATKKPKERPCNLWPSLCSFLFGFSEHTGWKVSLIHLIY